MLDFKNIITTPDMDVKFFSGGSYGSNNTGYYDYQTWHKPSTARMVYMMMQAGGGSGGWSANTANSAGGGGGGCPGSIIVGYMPAIYFPDTIYFTIGQGGQVNASMASTTSGVSTATGSNGVSGTSTIVSVDPGVLKEASFGQSMLTFGYPTGGAGGNGGNTISGGAAKTQPSSGYGDFWYKGIGRIYGQLATGGAGGNPGANGSPGVPVCGFFGGCGGGGSSNGSIVGIGGQYTGPIVNGYSPTFYQNTIGGIAASGAIPAGNGQDQTSLDWFQLAWGGSGGGGDSNTAGGIAGNGGNSSMLGGGGGGAGGSTLNNSLAIPGCGGDGMLLMIAW